MALTKGTSKNKIYPANYKLFSSYLAQETVMYKDCAF